MKLWKRKRSGAQIAADIEAETGVRIEYQDGRYAVLHPEGHWNYLANASSARQVAIFQVRYHGSRATLTINPKWENEGNG